MDNKTSELCTALDNEVTVRPCHVGCWLDLISVFMEGDYRDQVTEMTVCVGLTKSGNVVGQSSTWMI